MKIFAHRGASAEAPDNSPEAVRRAIEIGADGIEIDCHLTAGGQTAASHDPPGPNAPRLADVLEIIRPTKMPVVLDFKTDPKKIISVVVQFLPPGQILASSFKWLHLLWLKKNYPDIARGWIVRPRAFWLVWPVIFDKLLGVRSIHPCLVGLTQRRVRRWQGNGLKVYAWTVNTEADFEKCERLGMDGFFTDDPRKAKQWRMRKN